jgi:cell division protein FtsX
MEATWQPHEKHGRLTTQSDLPDSVYAFPKQRKEPLTDAEHVRNAAARFDQVEGVSAADRELAFANLKKAAAHYGVELTEKSVADFGAHSRKT